MNRQVLRSRRRPAKLVLGSAVFVAIGVWMIVEDGGWAAWSCAIFFGLCLVVGLMQVAMPPTLALDERGMTSRVFWWSDRYEWQRCSEFRSWQVPTARSVTMIAFDYDGPLPRFANANRRLAGATHFLRDTFGRKDPDLASLLNEWRQRAGAPS